MFHLADAYGGMVTAGKTFSFAADEPAPWLQSLRFAVPMPFGNSHSEVKSGKSSGGASGSGTSQEICQIRALAEMLERHAASCIEPDRVFAASARELGDYALDLATLPSCSSREAANPKCYVVAPQRDKVIRWVEGVSLTTAKTCALPLATVYLHAGRLAPAERLQAPISTGLAAHRTLNEALLSGLLEAIERDALSIMWLQMIPGRKLAMGSDQEVSSAWARSASEQLQYFFFDISTDLQVGVVCCLRLATGSRHAYTLVSCAAGFDKAVLIEKTMRDISAHSIGFRNQRPLPASFDDFTAVHHGATYMAHHDRASAFSFLLQGNRDNGSPWLTATAACDPAVLSPGQQLSHLLDQLRISGMEAYAVDLTSVEAYSAGMRVVRVLVPGLQPLPYRFASRYLGHPRLYDAPRKMAYRCLTEIQINPWPHPFA